VGRRNVGGEAPGSFGDLEPERIVRLETDAVVVLDQRRLPGETVELRCGSAVAVAEAIRTLAVRGAPAIGIAAAYGLVLAASREEDLDLAYQTLAASRPTAVNLRWALDELRGEPTAARARALHEAEVERCRSMAEHALPLFTPGARVLTHCNAGALATAGYGTALGAVRRAWDEGRVAHVWVGETRPLLQGGRLTAWELARLGIPLAVITDAAAASLMRAGDVDLVVTGADRIAANGDTANKIGTYALAVLARHHDVPFAVVAPTSTLDPAAPTGSAIPIEERAGAEVTVAFPAHNPAFDVTPAALVDAIVTEHGLHRPPFASSLPGHEGAR
jgi:methylthioribose-1-phosphate isomerase